MQITFENNIPVNVCDGCGSNMIGCDAFIFHSVQLNDCEYSLTEDQTLIRKDVDMGLCNKCYQKVLSCVLRLKEENNGTD